MHKSRLQRDRRDWTELFDLTNSKLTRAVLSQGPPRDAPNIWVPR